MVVNEEYEIITGGSLFCKCKHNENGEIVLIGKNTKISLSELQMKAMYPSIAKKDRGKRYSKKGKEVCGF